MLAGGRRAAGGWQAGSGQGLGSWLGVQGQPASEAWGYPGGAYPIALGVPRLPVQTQMHLILLLLF